VIMLFDLGQWLMVVDPSMWGRIQTFWSTVGISSRLTCSKSEHH
jgi:hypothetical protein